MLGIQILDGSLDKRPQKYVPCLPHYEQFTSLQSMKHSLVALSSPRGPHRHPEFSSVRKRSGCSPLSCMFQAAGSANVQYTEFNISETGAPLRSASTWMSHLVELRESRDDIASEGQELGGGTTEVLGRMKRSKILKVIPRQHSWALISEKCRSIFSPKYVQNIYDNSWWLYS